MNLVKEDVEWLKANEASTAFIQQHYYNGFHHSYRDGGAGKWTVFYGCTYDLDGCPVNKSSMWSDDYANQVFEKSQNEIKCLTNISICDNIKSQNEIIKSFSNKLTKQFGQGFSVPSLKKMKKFYQEFNGGSTLWNQLSWSHNRLIMNIDDDKRRNFYLEECIKSNWSVRQLERQINSFYYYD